MDAGLHDPLTGLYNAAYFREEMARQERGRAFPLSLIVCNLDGLKAVNDSRGTAAGDRIIRAAAQILRRAVRGNDVVARLGGDEFAVILPTADRETAASALERIRSLERKAREDDPDLPVAMSLGVATCSERGPLQELFTQADRQMRDDKAARRGGTVAPRSRLPEYP